MAILTGPKLKEQISKGEISLTPYEEKLVGTNSIDMRLHPRVRMYKHGTVWHRLWTDWHLKCLEYLSKGGNYDNYVKLWPPPTAKDVAEASPLSILDMLDENFTDNVDIPEEGMVMWPGILYLGRTVETIGSKCYVPWFDGRSSVGRLGIHVHVTAGRGDTGWFGTVTLEMHVVHPVRVYANRKPICQASFFETVGDLEEYAGRYQNQVDPTPSRFHLDEHDRLKEASGYVG